MSDRVKLAREIAARTEPRFIDMTQDTTDLKALAHNGVERAGNAWLEEPLRRDPRLGLA